MTAKMLELHSGARNEAKRKAVNKLRWLMLSRVPAVSAALRKRNKDAGPGKH
jgi:hypothetical protein